MTNDSLQANRTLNITTPPDSVIIEPQAGGNISVTVPIHAAIIPDSFVPISFFQPGGNIPVYSALGPGVTVEMHNQIFTNDSDVIQVVVLVDDSLVLVPITNVFGADVMQEISGIDVIIPPFEEGTLLTGDDSFFSDGDEIL